MAGPSSRESSSVPELSPRGLGRWIHGDGPALWAASLPSLSQPEAMAQAVQQKLTEAPNRFSFDLCLESPNRLVARRVSPWSSLGKLLCGSFASVSKTLGSPHG